MSTEKEQLELLISEIKELIAQDKELREKYQVGEKFRFVRDRLSALLDKLEKSLPAMVLEEKKGSLELVADEALVYVYLYNAQGLQFRSWFNMVNPKVFYEYSVNRPIYAEKSHIDTLLRNKANKQQHAYLVIAVKKESMLASQDGAKDQVGNSVIKVKEGSLRFEKVVAFIHNDQEYLITEKGELIKKD